MPIVWIGGTFDEFHPGHMHLIRAGRLLAGYPRGPYSRLVVAVNTDEFVQRYKGRPARQTEDARVEMVSELSAVDEVMLNPSTPDSCDSIERCSVDFILAGADWATEDGQKYRDQLGVSQKWLRDKQVTILFVPRVGGYASSKGMTRP